jgi:hypothetical protein
MYPRKSNLLGIFAFSLNLGFQIQLGEATKWSHSPPENHRLHPHPDSQKPRGLRSQQERLQQQWALPREEEDVKPEIGDPTTMQVQSISNT